MRDVLCLGEALVDLVATRRGPLGESPSFRRYAGGAPANVARALARLGAGAGWMWSLGADEMGNFLSAALAAEGVDTSRAVRTPRGRTELALVALDEHGDPTFSGYGFPGASRCFEESAVDPDYVASWRVLHFCSNTLIDDPGRRATLSAIAAAREADRLLSFDVNFRLHLWNGPERAVAAARQVIPGVHVVKLAHEEARLLTGLEDPLAAARRLRAWHAGLVVVTLGARGCVYAGAHHEGEVRGVPAEVVDATGAGDSFVAGMLHALLPLAHDRVPAELEAAELESVLARANAAGALATRFEGAVEWPAGELRAA
jgi:fructokinase